MRLWKNDVRAQRAQYTCTSVCVCQQIQRIKANNITKRNTLINFFLWKNCIFVPQNAASGDNYIRNRFDQHHRYHHILLHHQTALHCIGSHINLIRHTNKLKSSLHSPRFRLHAGKTEFPSSTSQAPCGNEIFDIFNHVRDVFSFLFHKKCTLPIPFRKITF